MRGTLLALGALVGLVVLAGCVGRRNEDFIPAAGNARKALEAALKSWQDGKPPGTLADVSPKVEVIDSRWKAGQQLSQFEILKEESNEQGHRLFTVRLTPPKGSAFEAKYVVFGLDPLWVYREEDFKKLSGTGM
jgi:hypothetical protein